MQPPDASWGTIIQDGQTLLYTRPAVSLAPGFAIVLTVLALNLFGDGVRDALTRYTTPLSGAYYVIPPVEALAPFAPAP